MVMFMKSLFSMKCLITEFNKSFKKLNMAQELLFQCSVIYDPVKLSNPSYFLCFPSVSTDYFYILITCCGHCLIHKCVNISCLGPLVFTVTVVVCRVERV